MGVNKRYYWWKLMKNYFQNLKIIKLKNEENGHEKLVTYLEMITYCINYDGIIDFEGACDNIEEEIALVINEKPVIVAETLGYLIKNGLARMLEDGGIYLPEAELYTGSETDSTIRSRKHRMQHQKEDLLQCNTDATKGNTEKEKELEIEKELKKEIEKEKKKEKEKKNRVAGGDIREQPKEKKGIRAAALHSAYQDIKKNKPNYPYTEEAVKQILEFYLTTYEQAMGEPHPAVTKKILDLILEKLPYCENENDRIELEPENYPDVIRQHFQTAYQEDCDYQIMHFMSGPIRLLRYYEAIGK